MSKLVLQLSTKKIEPYLPYVDAFLVGIQGMSVNLLSVNLQEATTLIEQCKNEQKEIFIALNKNMLEQDLDPLKKLLIELDASHPTGFVFYDVALVTLKEELGLETPLVWGQEHAATNYATCNFWLEQGIPYGILSGEITLDEIKELKKQTAMKLMVPMFGYLSMFVSKRPFLTNYTKYFGLEKQEGPYTLEKEGMEYPILEDPTGTTIYSGMILNGFQEYKEQPDMKIDYLLLNSFQIPEDQMVEVTKAFHDPTKETTIFDQFPNSDKGFLYKETIYKVKHYA